MSERHAALIEPALARFGQDRADAHAQLLVRQQQERAGLAHDREHGSTSGNLVKDGPGQALTLEQIMAYKAYAIGAVQRSQQLEQTRGEVTGHTRAELASRAPEQARKMRDREKTAQEKFDEYFAQHGDRLRREDGTRGQKGRGRGR
jgi:hypothetical protein